MGRHVERGFSNFTVSRVSREVVGLELEVWALAAQLTRFPRRAATSCR